MDVLFIDLLSECVCREDLMGTVLNQSAGYCWGHVFGESFGGL